MARVTDPGEVDELWFFYDGVFAAVNESTPIAQSWGRECFDLWMVNEAVVKIILRINGEIVAFAAVTSDLTIEPLLSPRYFAKHYPNGAWYIPAIAISPDVRSLSIARKLLELVMGEIPRDVSGVFIFHSVGANKTLPNLVTKLCRGRVIAEPVDTEACVMLSWADRTETES